jgi:hypothetical protein
MFLLPVDIDECKRPEDHGCFGECKNTNGSFDCWCAGGLHGNASQPNGCLKPTNSTGDKLFLRPTQHIYIILQA